MTVLDLEVRSNRATLNSAETKSVPVDRLETFVRSSGPDWAESFVTVGLNDCSPDNQSFDGRRREGPCARVNDHSAVAANRHMSNASEGWLRTLQRVNPDPVGWGFEPAPQVQWPDGTG